MRLSFPHPLLVRSGHIESTVPAALGTKYFTLYYSSVVLFDGVHQSVKENVYLLYTAVAGFSRVHYA